MAFAPRVDATARRFGQPVAPGAREAVAPARCYYVAKTGDDDADGAHAAPLRRIWRAIDLAGPGDFIYIRGGTWTQSEEATAIHCGDGRTRLAIVPIEARKKRSPTVACRYGADDGARLAIRLVR